MPVYTELQPVFNKVWQEFVVEKRARAVIGISCVYRGDRIADSNTRCALGVCIPDDMYDSRIEHHGSIRNVQKCMPEWFESVFNGIDPEDLRGLQVIHDEQFIAFESKMREFAEAHGLTIPE